MKKLFLAISMAFCSFLGSAAPVKNMPQTLQLPNGKTIECFITGDEFYRFLHDGGGYPITKGEDGYYYYATADPYGNLTATTYRFGEADPRTINELTSGAPISEEQYIAIRVASPLSEEDPNSAFSSARSLSNSDNAMNAEPFHIGTLNSVVIFIKLNDDPEFTRTYADFESQLNATTSKSLRSLFLANSYGKFDFKSHFLPRTNPGSNKITPYNDRMNRSYINNGGTPNAPETHPGANREHAMLARAIEWVNENSPLSEGTNVDKNNDGNVDNCLFVISGGAEQWGNTLWPHAWSLYSTDARLKTSAGMKRVYTYSLVFNNWSDLSVTYHETFHTVGAPDFYRYDDVYPNGTPFSQWDPMVDNNTVLGLTWNRWQYQSKAWVTDIPEITESGVYTLNSTQESSNNCFKIQSPYDPQTYFMVEYRQKNGMIESAVPGTGLLVYRIDSRYSNTQGGAYRDPLYMYRPGGTMGNNGSPNLANFSKAVNRAAINDATNPSCYLQDGSYGGLDISEISAATNDSTTISFRVNIRTLNDSVTMPVSSSSYISLTNQFTSGVLALNEEDNTLSAKKETLNGLNGLTSKFVIKYLTTYKFRFRLHLPGDQTKCLALAEDGKSLTVATYVNNNMSHNWELVWANKDGYAIRSCANRELYLQSSNDVNRTVELANRSAAKNQSWNINLLNNNANPGLNSKIKASAIYKITSTKTGLAFQPRDGVSTSGNVIVQKTSTGAALQLWQLMPTSDRSAYIIKNKQTGKVLSTRSKRIEGMQLLQEDDNGDFDHSQQWEVITLANGSYAFKNRMSTFVIDNSGKTADNAPLIVYSNSSASNLNQQFTLVEMEVPNLVQNPKFSQGQVYWSFSSDQDVTKGTTTTSNPVDGAYFRITHNQDYSFNMFQNVFKGMQPGMYEFSAQVRANGDGYYMYGGNRNETYRHKFSRVNVNTLGDAAFEDVAMVVKVSKDTCTIGFEGRELKSNNWIHIDNVSLNYLSSLIEANKGDVNEDSEINVSDIVAAIDFIIGQRPEQFDYDCADANIDNKVNVIDIVTIIQMIIDEEQKSIVRID